MTSREPEEFFARSVYAIFEYREDSNDSLQLVFEDDADTLRVVMDHASDLAKSESPLLTGSFHAAYGGEEHLEPGDWYLSKQHGVSVGVGLAEATVAGYGDVWGDCDECGTGGGRAVPGVQGRSNGGEGR